jgi:YHS domain-containing protein
MRYNKRNGVEDKQVNKLYAIIVILLAAGFFIVGLPAGNAAAAQKTIKAQTICPVMGDPINKKYYADYKGHRIYFCCNGCPEEFKKNPEKYMKILRESGVTIEKTPAPARKRKRQ